LGEKYKRGIIFFEIIPPSILGNCSYFHPNIHARLRSGTNRNEKLMPHAFAAPQAQKVMKIEASSQ
jgi:hypothetical protein